MEYRARVYPQESFYVAFLNTRDIKIAEKHEHVLHFFGDNIKKLNKLVKQDSPDLVVIHNNKINVSVEPNFPYVLDFIKNDKDIYSNKKIFTNIKYLKIVDLYYKRIALNREIITHEPKEVDVTPDVNVHSLFGALKNWLLW